MIGDAEAPLLFCFSRIEAKRLFATLELFALSVRVCLFAGPGVDVSMGTGEDGIVGGGGGIEERSFLPCVGCFDLLGDDICLAGGCSSSDSASEELFWYFLFGLQRNETVSQNIYKKHVFLFLSFFFYLV